MKKIIIGVIAGILLCNALPIKAAIDEYILYKADYSLVINGNPYADKDLPLLNYKGNTYAPVRSVFEAAGLKVQWNADLGQGNITTTTEQTATPDSTPTPTPMVTPIITPTPIPPEDIVVIDGRTYRMIESYNKCTVCGSKDIYIDGYHVGTKNDEITYLLQHVFCNNPSCSYYHKRFANNCFKALEGSSDTSEKVVVIDGKNYRIVSMEEKCHWCGGKELYTGSSVLSGTENDIYRYLFQNVLCGNRSCEYYNREVGVNIYELIKDN